MNRFLLVCLAGALGTGTRYLVGLWAGRALGPGFPYGTFLVNLFGCFLMSLVMQIAATTTLIPETTRYALTTGFMGGLTTYSSFNYETLRAFQEKGWGSASLNVAVTLVLCMTAGILGLIAGKRLVQV